MNQIKCGTERRRIAIKDSNLNGVDYLEVFPPSTVNKLPLLVLRFFKSDHISELSEDNLIIDGGVRIKEVEVSWVKPADEIISDLDNNVENLVTQDLNNPNNEDQREFIREEIRDDIHMLIIRPKSDGDFSRYVLRLVRSVDDNAPPDGFDVILSRVEFSFKVTCPSDFDCRPRKVCPPVTLDEPLIDYMVKDYASFRHLILDRLATLMPEWGEGRRRNPADLGIVLVELLAYIADNLSYYQDAVATEAYMGTARSRISIRRHARLLDYFMHDGCNARTWVHIRVRDGVSGVKLPAKTKVLTGEAAKTSIIVHEEEINAIRAEDAEIFETMESVMLYDAHNEIQFYTWGNTDCCLPKGTTCATIKDADQTLKLQAGDLLLFEETRSPEPEDVEIGGNLLHRQVVRLIKVEEKIDPLEEDTHVLDIEWHHEDALSFPLCVCKEFDGDIGQIGVCRGNIVLADHGYTVEELLDENSSAGYNFFPSLSWRPLTFVGPYNSRLPCNDDSEKIKSTSASSVFEYEVQNAMPSICLYDNDAEETEEAEAEEAQRWTPVRDLISSDRFARNFVVEMENDGVAHLRFGDGIYGMNPTRIGGTNLHAKYRIGNGPQGNVAAEAITRIAIPEAIGDMIAQVRNPVPAQGGKSPEKIYEVRRNAPEAFRKQERAVTEADYVDLLMKHDEIQKAAVTIRWTGSWYTIFGTIDRTGGRPITPEFKTEIRQYLDKYRLAGYDIEINSPKFVPLEIEISVCVDQDHLLGDVRQALLDAFSNRKLAEGGAGFFHADNFTFGQPVFLSKIYDNAMRVHGVSSASVTIFRRRGRTDGNELKEGVITMGSYEIVQLENDPNYPDKGTIKLTMQGGGR